MKRKSFRNAAISFGLVLVILLTTTAFVDKYYYVDKKLLAIEALINDYYVGEVDENKLQEGVYKGFVAGVGDIYTSYYTPEEYTSFQESTNGIYSGIGVTMTIDQGDNTILITEVNKDSPAQKGGILKGDKIVKVEGKTVTGDDFTSLPDKVKGKAGTVVNITIYRPSENKSYEMNLTRGEISEQTVTSSMLEDNLGYIKISKFEKITYDQFKAALTELEEQDAKGLILDLRSNPGGRLDTVEQIADELVPQGIVVSTKDKNGKCQEYTADDKYTDLPLVVLVNGSSASASEVLAGAIKDVNRGKLVGETTFGKGIVQTIVPLRDGSAIKLTTAQYFTPSGVCIHGIGIEPDYKVSLSTREIIQGIKGESDDAQLQKAVEVLKEEIK